MTQTIPDSCRWLALLLLCAAPAITRFGIKNTLVASITLGAVGLWHLSQIPVQGDFVRDLLPGMAITGFSIVMAMVAVTIAATAGVEDSEQGLVSGLVSTAQEIGFALGLAILVAIANLQTQVEIERLGTIAAVLVALVAIDKVDSRKPQAGYPTAKL